jgi:hypothetical protein
MAAAAAPDPFEERLQVLRAGLGGATAEVLPILLDGLDADAAVVAALSIDGRRLLAVRVERRCATAPFELGVDGSGVEALLAARCEPGAPRLSLDDPRLRPPEAAPSKSTPPHKVRRWPWIFVGAIAATAAIIGVTVGVVAADPRYAVKVDGRGFGAP